MIFKINKFTQEVYKQKPILSGILRVFLGVILLDKGIYFMNSPEQLTHLMKNGILQFLPTFIAHYVILAHIIGGAFLIIGLLTRVCSLIQLPILFGALFLIHFTSDLTLDLAYIIFTLILAIHFSIYGAQEISIDYYLQNHNDE